ncbi:MAG: N-acetyltransferase [Prevotellaceae bacterium]|jgi:GNAT superfamily N-acetyltransferase|nr:N-acetyltransferase [Prevotellaceae bacterium]
MIDVKEVKNKSELKKFIKFGTDLYEGNPYFCPPLVFDELNTFNPQKNPAHEVCDHIIYLAYKKGNIVGRIVGIINHRANEHWQNRRVRFGWFDFIDDLEVSQALLDAVKAWGKERGMDEMNGPVGFTDFDHQGLLIRGFEYNSPMASLYNFPYYLAHFENYGLVKDVDWIEYRVFIPDGVPEKMQRVANIVMEKYKLKISKVRNTKELVKRYGYTFLDMIDEAYKPLYNYQPLTNKQKKYYCGMYFPMINFDFVTIVVNEKDEIVGAGCGMPSISKPLRKCKGKLFPFGWISILKALKAKKFKYFDLLLIAVRPDYQNKGVNSLFFCDQIKYFIQYGVEYSETTSILETNSKNQANWEYFDTLQHKQRRAFVMKI